jgi:aryl-alcohol dehydrogenase-like predicted oxidoreductase
LTKLAIHFSAKNPSVDLNIVSMTSVDIVRDNVSYLSDLNENETNTLKEIRDT